MNGMNAEALSLFKGLQSRFDYIPVVYCRPEVFELFHRLVRTEAYPIFRSPASLP